MNDKPMCYVAADPQQPGAAWAATADLLEYKKDTAKEIANWVRSGATVMHVDVETARAMLIKWVRPSKAKKTQGVLI